MKDRPVCKNCYHKRKGKSNNNYNTLIQNYQPKFDKVNNKKNPALKKRLSNCGKTYLMNYILLQKQEPIFRITKSLNQNPNIKAQTADEIQPLENHQNITVAFETGKQN